MKKTKRQKKKVNQIREHKETPEDKKAALKIYKEMYIRIRDYLVSIPLRGLI